jgi:phosphoenolpyruvate carboxykinase (GTP)
LAKKFKRSESEEVERFEMGINAEVASSLEKILRGVLDEANFAKLTAIKNNKVHQFVAEAIELCEPKSMFVVTDSDEDVAAVRQMAIDNCEEKKLATEGHTVHFDGYNDQARDKARTKYLLPEGVTLSDRLNSMEKSEGVAEVKEFFKDSMKGRHVLVRFFCLGIPSSEFAIPVMQITDSAYVGHSEDLLYRSGYQEFLRQPDNPNFFRILHSAGKLSDSNTSSEVDKRRVYIDLDEELVYSVNTQYAGNTVGLKKLSLRLALRKAEREGWLAEHMFLLGAKGPEDRITYFLGAFPSACGKTSTAMIPGQTIIGDDLAYLRKIDGQVRAVNVERGIFGIISDVNSVDDPEIWKVLNRSGEVIFSNVLIKDDKPYWLGMGQDIPADGLNHSGQWQEGKQDEKGVTVTPSHKNARYTIRIDDLANCDSQFNNPLGVVGQGIIYGGRDSDTCVPVEESFGWAHGVITKGATIESETTAATLGAEGVRSFNLMSNIDFLSMPLGRYIEMHLEFAEGLKDIPTIFSVNYFLKGPDGDYLNSKLDKRVWLQWMELRTHGEVEAIETPTGRIPEYEDLKALFAKYLDKDYSKEEYQEQFKIRVPELIAKIDRVTEVYKSENQVPAQLFEVLAAQKERLLALQAAKGDHVSPFEL